MSDPGVLEIPDLGPAEWFSWVEERGWGDGLPTVPPTEDLVDAMLAALPSDLPEFGPLPPSRLVPAPRAVAANAVMAGCRPLDLPTVLAALAGVQQDAYNLHGTLATTHPCAPLIVVSGPVRERLGLNGAGNCFGSGTRANAVIGRALSLILLNLAGARPPAMDRSTQGSPAKYTYCFAENTGDSPWEPFGVRRGFDADESVVTVLAAEPPHNINDHGSTTGEGILTTIAGTMAQPGSNNVYVRGPHLLVLGPEHATTLHRDGWTVEAIRRALWERARIPVDAVSEGNRRQFTEWGIEPDGDHYTVSTGPEQLQVLVAGGAGKHSAWIPSFGATEAVSVRVPGG
ncbi:hypothetical protein SAMN05216207_100376 [Pseudonocardia ammonioxydans]|uniref:Uncharacterized protein n=1 Tax=Pseudonocardia ammonioxydans TaxID=260086 RepID=A0A1I4TY08_PSUAM|nr:hypothetical protein [Pseudonocardia ammonioxydans]SFM81686.1 hypothetical protein SAMN05216207_100376 [Pseudonocardia ammonioxydans]